MVKEPVGSFPHDNRQHSNVDTRVYLPDVLGVGVWHLMYSRVCQLRSAIRLARGSLMALVLARRRVSPSSRDSLARASLMASALARRRVSPSSRDSLARAFLMASVLARRRVSLSSGDSLARARSERVVSHKFFACLSESLGVESASHQQSLRVQFLQSYLTSSQTILNLHPMQLVLV